MPVISNTTPLSQLAKVGRLDLLRDVYGEIVIPQEVYEEVTTGEHPAVKAVRAAGWIRVRPLNQPSQAADLHERTGLGWGECEAIVLAQETPGALLLIDDGDARRAARTRGLRISGTIGVLLRAKALGLLANVRTPLDELRAVGTRIGDELYREALAAAGESL